MAAKEEISEIAQFFHGRSVLITGATGFVGKVLLEKIIRSCPTIAAVYILIRPKSGSDVNSRLTKLLDNVLFDQVKKTQPGSILKVRPISGDITLPELGISVEDRKELCQNVSVVFHSAASTNFNGKLRSSYKINVKGTSQVISLAKEMPNIAAFVHISTAFANCERLHIDETLYPMSLGAKSLENMLAEMSDAAVEAVKEDIFGEKKNTYVFTKALLENMLNEEKGTLPVGIVRPSIVGPAYREPIPGWLDDDHGYIEPIKLFGRGMGRTAHARRDVAFDVIPVDLFACFALATAWEIASSDTKTLRFFNYCSSGLNPITCGTGQQLINKMVIEKPISGALWYPQMTIVENKNFLNFIELFQLLIPAMCLDILFFLIGKKPVHVGYYRLYVKLRDATEYFRMNKFTFATDNMAKIYQQMSTTDKENFNFRLQEIDWKYYMNAAHDFGLKYILKETDADMKAARFRMKILYVIHMMFNTMLVSVSVFAMIYIFRFIFGGI